MSAPKGHHRYGGRQPGTPNKATEERRNWAEMVFRRAGGVEAFVRIAQRAEQKDPALAFRMLAWAAEMWKGSAPRRISIGGDPEHEIVCRVIEVGQ